MGRTLYAGVARTTINPKLGTRRPGMRRLLLQKHIQGGKTR